MKVKNKTSVRKMALRVVRRVKIVKKKRSSKNRTRDNKNKSKIKNSKMIL